MIRNLLSVVGAIFVGGTLIGVTQSLNMVLYPPPPGFDPNDPAQLAALMAQIPLGALLVVELSYALGCLAAGAVVGRLATSRHRRLALVIGGFFTLGGFLNLSAIPHPTWFAVLSTLTYVPAALLGVHLFTPPTRERAAGG